MAETVAFEIPKAACPTCGTRCELIPKKRSVTSIDDPVELHELEGRCPFCRRAFFPLRERLGFDARRLTPTLVQRSTIAAAETHSYKRATIVMREVGGQPVSAKTIKLWCTTWERNWPSDVTCPCVRTTRWPPEQPIRRTTWQSSSATGDGFARENRVTVRECIRTEKAGGKRKMPV